MEAGRHNSIRILSNSTIESIKGSAGKFEVTVIKTPRYVIEDNCVGCGTCAHYCPVKIPDFYNECLSAQRAIYIPYPQAVPAVSVIDPKRCRFMTRRDCTACRPVCEAKAIDLHQKEEQLKLNVGAIIASPGYDKFNPGLKGEYGYDRMKNVITGLEFERITSASGPTKGEILRPSDKKHPKRIAWIQCVGSRDKTCNKDYCSSVCCMYAIKQVIIAKEHYRDLEAVIFYNDIRTFGKGYEQFYERAKNIPGVRFINSIVSTIKEVQQSKNLIIPYAHNDQVIEEEFDLAVLSLGLTSSDSIKILSQRLSIDLNHHGFCKTSTFSPLKTSREGIYVAGVFQGPKDIPESIMMASGAASLSAQFLSDRKGSLVKEKEYPQEKNVSGESPRIGVLVCRCGVNIAGVADINQLTRHASDLDQVVYAEEALYACSRDNQEKIKQMIKDHNVNRLVVAACTPRTHESLFQDTIREAGLNRCLFEMVNIRDQCTWVHAKKPEVATQKAKDLIRMGVAKARLSVPLKEELIQVIPRGLIIGGGLSGMTAALALAEQGYECYLLEKDKELGGNLRNLYYTLNGDDPQQLLEVTKAKVMNHPLIRVYTEAQMKEVSGYIGNFKTTIISNEKSHQLSHGVIIVAIGAQEYQPQEYLYTKHERVVTQRELEKQLATRPLMLSELTNVVMIQCIGSRTKERPYCSRICCSTAIKNALKLKEINPSANIFVLHKDIRTYGLHEEFYSLARKEGIIFIKYDDSRRPLITGQGGGLSLVVYDPLIKENILIEASMIVLSAGIIPPQSTIEISKLLKVPLDEDGFFQEAHVKLRPVDCATDGVFICGLAHSPKTIDESVIQAQAAAARAAIPLSKGFVKAEPIISSVDKDKCFGCGICEDLCPYESIKVVTTKEGDRARTISAACKGCGICAARCPRQAIVMNGFTDEQIIAQIEAFAVNAK